MVVSWFQRIIYNLHRRGVPTTALQEKAEQFVANGDLTTQMAHQIIRTIEGERGKEKLINEAGEEVDDPDDGGGRLTQRLSLAEMQAELDKRIAMMRAGAAGTGLTDQARVFDYIVQQLEQGEYLRLMLQATRQATEGLDLKGSHSTI